MHALYRRDLYGIGAVSSADASALVRLGKTTVICGLKLEVGMPLATAPNDGRLGTSMLGDVDRE